MEGNREKVNRPSTVETSLSSGFQAFIRPLTPNHCGGSFIIWKTLLVWWRHNKLHAVRTDEVGGATFIGTTPRPIQYIRQNYGCTRFFFFNSFPHKIIYTSISTGNRRLPSSAGFVKNISIHVLKNKILVSKNRTQYYPIINSISI